MKFLSAALSGLMLASTASAKSLHKLLAKNTVVNKEALMKTAVRVNRQGEPIPERQLENQEFEIQPYHSISFDSCVSLRTNDENLFDEDIYEFAYAGTAIGQKSFVIFNVCQTGYCGYEGEEMLYMVELGEYVATLAAYIPAKKEAFCEACQQNEEFCNPDQDQQADGNEDQDGEGDADEEGDERRLANYINCNKCFAQGCYNEDQDGDGYVGDEDVVGWIEEMSQCVQTESVIYNSQGNEMNLNGGFMCNNDGSGIEVAVFLDDDCGVYYTQENFDNIVDYEDKQLYALAEEYVMYTVLNDTDCAADVEYDEYGAEEDGNNYDEEEANEICGQLMENAVDLETCAYDGNDQDDNNNGGNQANYAWYDYDIDAEQIEDIEDVCKFLQEFEGEAAGSDFDETTSGHHYDWTRYEGSEKSSASGAATAGKIIGIIVLVALVAVAAVFAVKALGKDKKDSKAEPLTKNQGGALA